MRSGALSPERLLHVSCSRLANLNRLVALVAALLGSTQAFTLVTPKVRVPRWLVSVFLLVVRLNTLAAF